MKLNLSTRKRFNATFQISLFCTAIFFLAIGVSLRHGATPNALPTPVPALQGEAALNYLKEQKQYASLQAAMQAARYRLYWVDNPPAEAGAGGNGAWQATNPGQQYTAFINAQGLLVSARQSKVKLRVREAGYGRQMQALEAGPVNAENDRIETHHHFASGTAAEQESAIIEWFVNRPAGLEQGFTLASPPAGRNDAEPLRLTLALSGDLRATTEEAGQAVSFRNQRGAEVLRYGGLQAVDARGRKLAARMAVDGDRLEFRVEDRDAIYPLTIDPTFTQQAKLTASDGAADDRLGSAVAISGNTILIGAPDSDISGLNLRGSVQVFIRNGSSWSFQARLVGAFIAGERFGSAVSLSGDSAVIGAPFYNGANSSQGAAYVFTRSNGIWTQQSLLTASDPSDNSQFGRAVAIEVTQSDSRIVVGATSLGQTMVNGSAYVFRLNGATWVEEQKLIPLDGAAGDLFGWSVAFNGSTAVIGAPSDDIGANTAQGSAYVFLLSGATWSQQAKLTASDGAASDILGWSVAVSGNTALVGAYLIGGNQPGKAYVFTRNGVNWTQQQKLTASDGAGGDGFGVAVALAGDQAIIGAAFDDISGNGDQGSVYSFTRTGNVWTEQQKFTAADAGAGKGLGIAVAIGGETVIAGAAGDDIGANANQGSAYVFSTAFPNQTKVLASNGATEDNFGLSVAVDGDTAIVGTPGPFGMTSQTGRAFIFIRSGNNWTQQQILTAPDGASGDRFGDSVAISGETVLIGASSDQINANQGQGSAYVFTRSGVVWSFQQKLTASDGIAVQIFGASVSLAGNLALIGAPGGEGGSPSYAGAAYTFTRTGNVWTQQQRLNASDGTGGDRFGRAVSLSGLLAVIGAPGDDPPGADSQGSAYIFEQLAGVWTQQTKLTASDGIGFGQSVAIGGTPITVLIGAPYSTVNSQIQQGAAYIFTGGGTTWTQQQKLTDAPGANDHFFGESASINNNLAVVGADGTTINGVPQGAAYVFQRNGASWTLRDRLTAADGLSGDAFGFSASISGGTALAGAFGKDTATAVNQGAAYFFALCPNAITVNPATLPNATVGTAYSQAISATGGTGAVSFAITSGALPAGLSLNGATGLLSGTPTASGTANFTVTASDSTGCPGARAYTLTVTCPAITLSPSSLPAGTVNAAYNQTITASGGNGAVTFSVISGSLPAGITLSAAGLLSGTTTQTGTFNFIARAQDSTGCSGSRPYTLTINCQTITVNPATLPNPTLSVAYNQTLTATGGVGGLTFNLQSGSLPTGLSLSAAGVISGTTNSAATTTFTARVIDANGCQGTRVYTLTPGCAMITISPSSLPQPSLGVAYNQQFTQTGGSGGINWSVGSGTLPPGLSLLASGLLTGTPNTPGDYTFSIQANASGGCAGSAQYTLRVPCPTITISPATLPSGTRNTSYSQTLNQTGGGGAINWMISAGALPSGFSLNPTSGLLSGVSSQTGDYSFSVTATDANGCSGTRNYLLTVNCQTITLNPATLPTATIGTAYNQVVLANGASPPLPFTFTLSAGALPPGLNLLSFPINAVIDGTPTQSGVYNFTLRVTDGNNCPGEQAHSLTVTCPTITVNPSSLPQALVGGAYSQTITATGGGAPLGFSVSAGVLPAGLTLSADGVLTGTPTVAGSFDFTVRATDANACFGEQAYSLCIYSISAAVTGFRRTGGNGAFNVTSSASCPWTAVSNDPGFLTINGGATGNGNGVVTYSVAENLSPSPRSGSITIAGFTFYVTQQATGSIVQEDFSNGIPPTWTVIDGGSPGTYPNGGSVTWTTANPCNQTFVPPFSNQVAIVDATCAPPGTILDEELRPPAFDATGLGTVYVEFFSQFKWSSLAPDNKGDVDVSTDGGATWTNVLRLENGNDGVPTPATKSIDITPAIIGNPANVLVRLRYYGTGLFRSFQPARPEFQELSWGIDFSIYSFNLTAGNQSFPGSGGNGSVTVAASVVVPTPQGPWTATSNAPWIRLLAPGGTGNGSINYTVDQNPMPTPRIGTMTIAGQTVTITQAAGTCPAITINPASLPNASAGSVYNQPLTGTGGASPYGFTILSGELPAGLTLSSGGLLTGTPTVFGNFNFTVQATDANSCAGLRSYTLTVTPPCGAISISPATLPDGVVGTAYSRMLMATGGDSPYGFVVSAGIPPAGLTLSSGGLLSGTPTAAGTFNFTVTVTDAKGCTGARAYTVVIGGNGLQFYPLAAPVRLLDTRNTPAGCVTNTGPIAANATRTQAARTACSTIPANATAVIGNITVVPSGPGFLTLFPSDSTQPTVANSNFKTGEVTNNFFTVGLGASGADAGAFKIFTSATTDVIIDLTGYYAPPAPGGLYYHPLPSPVRLVQTFPGQTGCFANPTVTQLQGTNDPNANPALDLAVDGRGAGLPSPCNSIPSDAVVLVGNATTVFPNAPFGFGYLTIYPSDATRPTVAISNYGNNDIINGPFAVKLGADGKFKIYTFSTTHLVIDVSGYYSTSANDANGVGLLFNPLPKPMRLLETRADFPGFPLTGCYRPNAPIPGGTGGIRTQQVWGTCSDQPITIPNAARAVVGNVTVINPANAGFGTFFPGDVGTAPTVATTNYPFPVAFGYNRHYYVGLSPTDGTFKILTQFTSDYIVDVSGYFAP